MDFARLRHAALLATALALLLIVILLPPGAPAGSQEFRRSAAGVHGRVQMLRQLEKAMFASFANPERALWYLGQRRLARRQIDELMRRAQKAAVSAEQRRWLEQLATLTRVADERFEQLVYAALQRKPLS